MLNRIALTFGLIGAALVTPALAETYKFTLHNESQYAINGFQTFEDGKWTTWNGVKTDPGTEQTMDWNSDEGKCNVPFRIIYKDVETEQYTVNWCKISNIHVHDDSVTAD